MDERLKIARVRNSILVLTKSTCIVSPEKICKVYQRSIEWELHPKVFVFFLQYLSSTKDFKLMTGYAENRDNIQARRGHLVT